MTHLLANRVFARFWLAGLFFVLATWSLHIAMLVTVFDRTGSTFAAGLIPVFASLPGIIVGPLAGVLVDRWDRKRVMAGSSLALIVLLILALPFAHRFDVAALYAIIFVEAVVMTFFSPAENAMLPTLVHDDDLATANSLNALNDNLGRVIGPAVGAGVLVQLGFSATLITCAALFAISLACLVGVRTGPVVRQVSTNAGGQDLREMVGQIVREFREGLGAIRTSRVLTVVVAVWGLFMVADVPFSAVFPAFLSDSLHVGPEALGTMLTIRGLTGIAGGFLVVTLSRRISPHAMLAGGLLGYGASTGLLGVINDFRPGLWLTIVNGPSAAAIQTGLATNLQRATAPELRGRVFSLVGIVNSMIVIVVSLAAGSLGEVVGSRAIVILSGSLQLLPFLLLVTTYRWTRNAKDQPCA